MDAAWRAAAEQIRRADRILVLTGAGISAESGVPTFRGPDGLWKRHRPEELATPGAFRRDPRLVWEWYGWRRDLVQRCRPNAGHLALARLALARPGVDLVTQNVDGLHAAAAVEVAGELGAPPDPALPLELHGSIYRTRCTRCGVRRDDRGPVDAASEATLPRCDACSGLLRPDVVWFGESLDPGVLARAGEAAGRADLCLVVGTSALVHPAAGLPLQARAAGAAIIEVNPEPTPISPVADIVVRSGAAAALPAIVGD